MGYPILSEKFKLNKFLYIQLQHSVIQEESKA